MTIRVLVADDHALVRAGLAALLRGLDGVEVVGEASDGHDTLAAIARLRPTLAIVDVAMPGLNGLEVAARVARGYPEVHVIVLSMHSSEEYVLQALRAGARGYLLKGASLPELELAVRAVARGETYLSPAVSGYLVGDWARGRADAGAAGPLGSLTPRQREVLQLIAEGHTTKEIARRLSLSVKTVETHRAQLMERLDIHDIAGLVRYALRSGLVAPEP